jgi:hypothetical protein
MRQCGSAVVCVSAALCSSMRQSHMCGSARRSVQQCGSAAVYGGAAVQQYAIMRPCAAILMPQFAAMWQQCGRGNGSAVECGNARGSVR